MSRRDQTRLATLLAVLGVVALLAIAEATTAGLHALGSLLPLVCIWRPDLFHRVGQFLALWTFERWSGGLLDESAHVVGWFVLAAWLVGVFLEVVGGL